MPLPISSTACDVWALGRRPCQMSSSTLQWSIGPNRANRANEGVRLLVLLQKTTDIQETVSNTSPVFCGLLHWFHYAARITGEVHAQLTIYNQRLQAIIVAVHLTKSFGHGLYASLKFLSGEGIPRWCVTKFVCASRPGAQLNSHLRTASSFFSLFVFHSPISSNMAMDHGPTSMRDFFKFTADRLLASLSSMPGPYINHDKLPSGTFAISSFNPEDNEDLDSSDWLFHPMPQDRLSRFSLDRTGLPPDADSTGFQEYSENRNPATLAERMEQAPGQRAIMLEECFRIMYIDWERKLIGKSLIEKTEWEPVV